VMNGRNQPCGTKRRRVELDLLLKTKLDEMQQQVH
jgi:hypothetical protein